jgi:surface-anchored protein
MKAKLVIASAQLLAATLGATAQNSLPPDQFAVLTHEHVDALCVLYAPAGSNLLSLVAWHRDAELDLPTNQVIFVVNTQAMIALPSGTPFGDGGQPFWILPQSQTPNLLYLGAANTERVPDGVFSGPRPLTISLKRLEGPGYLMAWQATGPGQYNIRINTRDGVDTNDSFNPLVPAHEHFNWGFSSPGVYSATFQVTGQRLGESTNIFSPESTFVFHVLPLPPPTNYQTWARSYWPPGFNPPTTLTNGNADGDLFDNLLEYAFHLSPTNVNGITNAPLFSWVSTNGERYGAFTFTRYKPGLDLSYEPVVKSQLTAETWETLTSIVSVLDNGLTETVTVRDFLPAAVAPVRFYQLRTKLLSP